ncbi:hypothetical protein EDC04DRAFT_869032 [Pisolithus marmoratus]|nr:hypothetical protein EDC04DRAFT_869032 [Pisolithus marmoratus]
MHRESQSKRMLLSSTTTNSFADSHSITVPASLPPTGNDANLRLRDSKRLLWRRRNVFASSLCNVCLFPVAQDGPIASLVVSPSTHILPTSEYVIVRACRSVIDTHLVTPLHALHRVLCSRTRINVGTCVVSTHMYFFGFSFTSYVGAHANTCLIDRVPHNLASE